MTAQVADGRLWTSPRPSSASALEPLELRRSALLVIDLQNAFCHPDGTLGISGVNVAPAAALVPRIRRLAIAFADAGGLVLWTKQEHFEPDVRRARKRIAAHTSRRKQVSALSGSWDAAFVDEIADVAERNDAHVIRKHRFGAFYETRLQVVLETAGIEALFIVGATTNACVETTIREAYLRDYDVVAVDDCIAGVRPEWEAVAKQVWGQYFCALSDAAAVDSWLAEQARPAALQLDHVLLDTADVDRLADFYIGRLRLAPSAESAADGIVRTRQGIWLRRAAQPSSPGGGLALAVRGLGGLVASLRSAGVKIIDEIESAPHGRSACVEDPDGRRVRLTEICSGQCRSEMEQSG